eukprot:scaffold47001_cov42-Prasinocladus_malaysianus.AAC.2
MHRYPVACPRGVTQLFPRLRDTHNIFAAASGDAVVSYERAGSVGINTVWSLPAGRMTHLSFKLIHLIHWCQGHGLAGMRFYFETLFVSFGFSNDQKFIVPAMGNNTTGSGTHDKKDKQMPKVKFKHQHLVDRQSRRSIASGYMLDSADGVDTVTAEHQCRAPWRRDITQIAMRIQ